ncbi:TonB-dependent receptor [Dyadobacter sp. CY347]|uniref:TonB-dependent receptor n=1 Tax=Dyadobacter sp. CY347 TaxID=2909336 RepID=UPI001F2EB472|nr:carboxypeptidase regulatory-like domain-containing protein [Dyadobacter sp. CY347]MCF2487568.1 carboxypeptidase regulatory-like domain-containing protein [Dyadobacter sp. CY347]
MKNSTRLLLTALLMAGLWLTTALDAAAQATDASIIGTVKDAGNNELLPGATITVRNEGTGFETHTVTNAKGEYALQQLPLGKPYSISVSFVGLQTVKQTGYSLNYGDKLNVDIALSSSETALKEVLITEKGYAKEVQQAGASTSITAAQIKNLPNEGRNFTRLNNLSPLQGGDNFSFGGQRATGANVTIDGMNAKNQWTNGTVAEGPYAISLEAIREYKVITNDYDVTQGRQSGGAISAVTKSGTNKLEGSAFVYFRNNTLSSSYDIRGVKREQDFNNYQSGFSLGGPLIKDKLHFFVAYDRQDASQPFVIADIQSADDEQRYGIRKDSLDKLIRIASELYGLKGKQYGQFPRKTTTNTAFVRLDWQINQKHKLTLRSNTTHYVSPFNDSDNSNINLLESYNNFKDVSTTAMAALRSSFTPKLTNEFKVQYMYSYKPKTPQDYLPFQNIPRAIVNVTSPFPTESNPNATQTKSVQFGGQRFSPESNRMKQLHLSNTAYLNTDKVNFTFGTDNMFTYMETYLSSEQNGRFFFSSLTDLANLNPYRYAREVPLKGAPIVEQNVLDISAFAQADFNLHRNLNVVLGVRYDATAFLTNGEYNATVDREVGVRTDIKPQDWNNIQPRFQATWDIGGKKRDILKLGGGMFSSQPHYYAHVNNIQNSGTMVGAIDVTGAAVPRPDFNAYRQDPNSIPGIPDGVNYISTINAVNKSFQVPTTFKANINYNHFFGDRIRVGVNGIIGRTINNYVYLDRNLVDSPYFQLTNEDNRGVFVPASSISAKGVTDWLQSRKSTNVGRVLELVSDGISDQLTFVADASVRIGRDGYVNASYTINSSKDNSSYNCCVANTSTGLPVKDDPRKLNYGYSDQQFRNKLVINGAAPSIAGFQLGATLIGIGGSRYNFLIGGNTSLNGDFVLNNDLAYVFDPNNPSTPESISKGINDLLSNPETDKSIKDYINSNIGRVAERNGGENPFYTNIDLRLTKAIRIVKNQNIELSADAFNFLNILNKEWGRNYNRGNTNLLNVNGFDQATQQYKYAVQNIATRPIGGTPWRIQLGLRYSFN